MSPGLLSEWKKLHAIQEISGGQGLSLKQHFSDPFVDKSKEHNLNLSSPEMPMSSDPVSVSIIVPVYNNAQDLSDCLSALISAADAESEIIVVDDASTDNTPAVAAEKGVRVLRLANNSGPGAARNYGACHSNGDILFFVDSDVVVAPDAVRRIVKVFEDKPEVAAVFGSYDNQPRDTSLVSQYRNLLHHYVHQNGQPNASTFWAGCGAVRRSVFEAVGGFDENFRPVCSVEDIELGYRIRRAGHGIFLDKDLQGTHLKRWTLGSVILNDITHRAIPWSRLILESKNAPNDLNLKTEQRICFFLVALAFAFLGFSLIQPVLLAGSAAAFLGVGVLNRKLYTFFFRQRGMFFTAACVPLHLLYYVYSGLSYAYVLADFHLKGVAKMRRASRVDSVATTCPPKSRE